MQQQNPAFEKNPIKWIEASDLEKSSFEKATWIPLLLDKTHFEHGKPSSPGHRKAYQNYDSIIVPTDLVKDFHNVDWQSVSRMNPDGAWADEKTFTRRLVIMATLASFTPSFSAGLIPKKESNGICFKKLRLD